MEKPARPLIGFCGQADSRRVWGIALRNLYTQAAYALHWTDFEPIVPVYTHIWLRQRVLRQLATHDGLDTRFIVRVNSTTRTTDNPAWRDEFITNLRDTAYTVCVRGTANYSIRFFESLAMGRIPIFVNTDCVLPYAEHIAWRDHCVWVEERDISTIAEQVLDFHARLSPAQFRDLLVANRQLWLDWLSPQGFYAHLQMYLDEG